MKPIVRQSNKKVAFTIVELLTVMSIIIILIGLLVPALNMVKRYARKVRQKAQFHSIDVAMELFNTEFDGYPDSGAKDEDAKDYCGAMKLCEAMMGMDLLGFHPASHFRSDGKGSADKDLYDDTAWTDPAEWTENLKSRKGPYLQLENANAYRLKNLYGTTDPFDPDLFVLCDVYTRVRHKETGKKVGMPILYYKADTSKTVHDVTNEENPQNIYDYKDNDELVKLGMPWNSWVHPIASGGGETSSGELADPKIFYVNTKNDKITITTGMPYRSDSYILISAGFDGEYGTPDDVFNFGD